MPASSFAERVGWHAAFARQTHQGFGVHAEKYGPFLGIDIRLGPRMGLCLVD